MNTPPLGQRRNGWRRPVSVPESLDRLRGPLSGRIRLPLAVYSSGQGPEREFDLSDRVQRVELYEIVLSEGRIEDICRYLNAAELIRLWPNLWLAPHVRLAWQTLLGAVGS